MLHASGVSGLSGLYMYLSQCFSCITLVYLGAYVHIDINNAVLHR